MNEDFETEFSLKTPKTYINPFRVPLQNQQPVMKMSEGTEKPRVVPSV